MRKESKGNGTKKRRIAPYEKVADVSREALLNGRPGADLSTGAVRPLDIVPPPQGLVCSSSGVRRNSSEDRQFN